MTQEAPQPEGHTSDKPTEATEQPYLLERVVRLEAGHDHINEGLRENTKRTTEAHDKIDEKFEQLFHHLMRLEKNQNKTMWLVIGGFGTVTGLGAIALWIIRMGSGVTKIIGG